MVTSKPVGFWLGKKVLVTGGTGFIGSHVVEKLHTLGANVSILDHIRDGTIRNIPHLKNEVRFISGDCGNPEDAMKACRGIDVVMNLAAHVGGIEYNRTHQATLLSDNLKIATTMLDAAKNASVERFLVVSTACVYPHNAQIPTPETEGMRDEPEPTNGGYGWAKRMAEKLGTYYAEEFGMKIGVVRPYNAYGPRDHFDSSSAHVIPALIKRITDGENPLVVWGSGKQTRAFVYVGDVAEGMIGAIEKYPNPDPVNIGSDEEVSIADLVKKIMRIAKAETEVRFDTAKPDGSPRRNSDNSKAEKLIGFRATTSLDEGLQKTVRWWLDTKNRR